MMDKVSALQPVLLRLLVSQLDLVEVELSASVLASALAQAEQEAAESFPAEQELPHDSMNLECSQR